MPLWNRVSAIAPIAAAFLFTFVACAAETPQTVANWKMELIAEAPKIKYPSVVACAPDGKVFVAEDPMDIARPAHVAEGRIVCFHPDGRATVFAEGLHAVFGMQYLEGKLYVLHNPRFSVFRDHNGVGKDRAEIIEQTNPNPWALDWNDHVPANFRLGMDGRFYVAVGDKGVFGAVGRDGKRVDLHGGGILRLRPDGMELEVYSTGVRNILDVGMTDEDEIFTYDNTDENQWMGRVTHMVDGGFYGYPFDFIPQRPYTLWMMADYGAGAATGVTCNTDDALPPEYRDNLFLADFGQRNVRRVEIERSGGSFRAIRDEQLFINPPPDFRPVGITFSDDGSSIYICDWQHRDVKDDAVTGRLWRLTWIGKNHATPRPSWYLPAAIGSAVDVNNEGLAEALSHRARSVRMAAQRQLVRRGAPALEALRPLLKSNSASIAEMHSIWAADQIDEGKSLRGAIVDAARGGDARVARQAIRQLGNRRVTEATPLLIDSLKNTDASIRFQAATALGRIGDWRATEALVNAGVDEDLFARYAAFTAANRIARGSPDAWPAIIRGLKNENMSIREASAFATRETFDKELIRMLAAANRYAATNEIDFQVAILKALAPMHHKTREWNGDWWAYHPFRLEPPAKTNDWEGTPIIFETLSASLTNSNSRIRAAAGEGLGQFGGPAAGERLMQAGDSETSADVLDAMIAALARMKYANAAPLVVSAIRSRVLTPDIVTLARASASADVIVALTDLVKKNTPVAENAIRVLSEIGATNSAPIIAASLAQTSAPVRIAAIEALGSFKAREFLPAILRAADDPAMRKAAILAAARMPDVRATDVLVAGLQSADTRAASRNALTALRDGAWPKIAPRLETLPSITVAELQRIYRDYPPAQGAGLDKFAIDRPPAQAYLDFAVANSGDAVRGEKIFNDRNGVACINCHRVRGKGVDIGPDLSGVGAQFDRRALAESVLFPSRAVREGYNVIDIELTDGETLSGMIRAESSDALSLQSAAGEPQAIPKLKIKARRSTAVSLMPEGLESAMSVEDFSDLISYLQTLRSGT